MSCNLVIQSAVYSGQSADTDMTQLLQSMLQKQYTPGAEYFEVVFNAENFKPFNPVDGDALGVTFYWQERGATWTCTTSCAPGQTLKIGIATPPKIVSAVYSSPNVSVDVTRNLQLYISLHAGANYQIQVGSPQFLNALFGSVVTSSGNKPVDPDFGVKKSLYVCYTQLYNANNQEETRSVAGSDGRTLTLI